MRAPLIVAISGGPASGKSAICQMMVDALEDRMKHSVAIVSQDSFRRHVKINDITDCLNDEHPDAYDLEKMAQTLQLIIQRKPIRLAVYDHHKRQLLPDSEWLQLDTKHVSVVLVEGTLLLYSEQVRQLLNIKLFVDIDSDLRLTRRVRRDVELFHRSLDQVLREYVRFVKPCFEHFIQPTKKLADIVLPRGESNGVALDLIIQHIRDCVQGKVSTFSQQESVVSDMLYFPSTLRALSISNEKRSSDKSIIS